MSRVSRELVYETLRFEYPERIPRDLWVLPWAEMRFSEQIAEIGNRFPNDFLTIEDNYLPSPRIKGDRHRKGVYVDEWGCTFVNLTDGIIGEVKEPLFGDEADLLSVSPPYDILPKRNSEVWDRVDRICAESDLFIFAGCMPRPWERYQFLRGSENALVDVILADDMVRSVVRRIHEFYLREMELWVKTEVDAIKFMDDWGAQDRFLIPPQIWRDIFKPLYRDYCELAHSHNKFIFMHTDGHVLEIMPDIIEVGVDAINAQLYCMDMAELAHDAGGRITFWGEIDRQHVLVSDDPQKGRDAVRQVADHLYDPAGGIIAQFEFGLGTNPAVATAIFEEWEKIGTE